MFVFLTSPMSTLCWLSFTSHRTYRLNFGEFFGKNSVPRKLWRRKFRSAKFPFGENSVRWKFRSAKIPSAKIPSSKIPSALHDCGIAKHILHNIYPRNVAKNFLLDLQACSIPKHILVNFYPWDVAKHILLDLQACGMPKHTLLANMLIVHTFFYNSLLVCGKPGTTPL